jgi:hypothetical protein
MRARVFASLLMLGAIAAAPPPSDGLEAIMAALRAVRHVEARYVERRTLQALSTPIETRGTLRFDAPDRLEKAADPGPDGSAERLTVDRDRITIARGHGAADISFSLAEHPEIGVLVDSIRATLAGDRAALRRAFTVAMAGSVAGWQIVLQPRAHRDILQWMRITGHGGRITRIDTMDGDGDGAEMTITETTP